MLAVAAGVACSDRGGTVRRPDATASLLEARADTGLEMRVVLGRDTVSSRDIAPLEVFYFIVNGPTLTRFDNDPDRFSFKLTRLDHSPVQPVSVSSPILVSQGDRIDMTLPGGALFGQVQDLRCIVQGRYVASRTPRSCLAAYDLREPGTYRVIVEYRGRAEINLDSLTALADSGKLEYPIKYYRGEGRQLADTTTLVIRP